MCKQTLTHTHTQSSKSTIFLLKTDIAEGEIEVLYHRYLFCVFSLTFIKSFTIHNTVQSVQQQVAGIWKQTQKQKIRLQNTDKQTKQYNNNTETKGNPLTM